MKKMWQAFSQRYCGVPRKNIEDFVRKCPACAIHHPLKDRDIERNITASQNWERIQIDLIDLRQYSALNDNFSWILHVLDVYSKFSFVFPMKNKSATEVNFILIFY
jgi:hypothetical protein